jgi:hypothetical protein
VSTVDSALKESADGAPERKTHPAPPDPSPEGATYYSPGRKSGVSSIKGNRVPQGRQKDFLEFPCHSFLPTLKRNPTVRLSGSEGTLRQDK